jgi:hypothetical protein
MGQPSLCGFNVASSGCTVSPFLLVGVDDSFAAGSSATMWYGLEYNYFQAQRTTKDLRKCLRKSTFSRKRGPPIDRTIYNAHHVRLQACIREDASLSVDQAISLLAGFRVGFKGQSGL